MGAPINTPRTAKLITNPTTVVWSGGAPFNGYVVIGVQLPTVGKYPNPSLWASQRPLPLPRSIKVPIIDGQIDTTTALFFTADLDPPGTHYNAYYFDRLNNLIAPALNTAPLFTITNDPTTLTVPTLPLPDYTGAVGPNPLTSLCSTNIAPLTAIDVPTSLIFGSVGINVQVGTLSTIPVLIVPRTFTTWRAICTQFPTGQDILVDIKVNGVTEGTVDIPAGASGWQAGVFTPFNVGLSDILQGSVRQVGSGAAGQGLSIALY